MSQESVSTEATEVDYQAAGELLFAAPEENPGITEEEKPAEPEQTEKQGTPEAKAEEKEEEKAEEKVEEKPKEPQKDTPSYRWAKLREREGRVKQAMAEAKSIKESYAQKETELKELLSDLMENPVEAFNALAERAGADPRKAYEKLVRGQLMRSDESPAAKELRELKQEVLTLKKALKKEPEVPAISPERREAIKEEAATVAQTIYDSEENMQAYPNLSELDPEELEGQVRWAVDWAIDNNPKITLPQVLAELEKIEGEKIEKRIQRRNARLGNGASKTPAGNAPQNGMTRKSRENLSGRDAAEVTAPVEYKTQDERYAAAGALLFK